MNQKPDKPASSYDVAKLAGVSQSTVSRIFNQGGVPVSKKTRDRVLAAVAQLGYQPNNIARSLAQKKTRLIGLVISKLNNPVFAQVLDEFSRQLTQAGYNILLLNITRDEEIEDALAKAMQKSLVRHNRRHRVDTPKPMVSNLHSWATPRKQRPMGQGEPQRPQVVDQQKTLLHGRDWGQAK